MGCRNLQNLLFRTEAHALLMKYIELYCNCTTDQYTFHFFLKILLPIITNKLLFPETPIWELFWLAEILFRGNTVWAWPKVQNMLGKNTLRFERIFQR